MSSHPIIGTRWRRDPARGLGSTWPWTRGRGRRPCCRPGRLRRQGRDLLELTDQPALADVVVGAGSP
ncbi:hypothetical protein ACRAWF_33240 [Streptomyces sp. L7]